MRGHTHCDTEKDRDHSTNNQRVADTCDGTHQTCTKAVDGLAVNIFCTVCSRLFKTCGDTDNDGTELRLSIEECSVRIHGLSHLVGIIRIELFAEREHRAKVTECLHVLLREACQVTVIPSVKTRS